jgi:hypothetical protein
MEDSDSEEVVELDDVEDANEEVQQQPRNAMPRIHPFLAHIRRAFQAPAARPDEDAGEEAAEEDSAGAGGPEVKFDTSLPAQHAYLGAGQEVSGRTILEEDLVQTLPLLSMPGFVLVPNQVFPLTLFHPAIISLM